MLLTDIGKIYVLHFYAHTPLFQLEFFFIHYSTLTIYVALTGLIETHQNMVYRKKYQWEKLPYWYFFLLVLFPINDRKKYHKVCYIYISSFAIFLFQNIFFGKFPKNFVRQQNAALNIFHRLTKLIVVLTKRL